MTQDFDWQPIDSAPYGRVLWVRNPQMEEPCKATRGYVYNGMVHENQSFFTTVYTTHRFFPTPAGKLCCPTEWADVPDEDESHAEESAAEIRAAVQRRNT